MVPTTTIADQAGQPTGDSRIVDKWIHVETRKWINIEVIRNGNNKKRWKSVCCQFGYQRTATHQTVLIVTKRGNAAGYQQTEQWCRGQNKEKPVGKEETQGHTVTKAVQDEPSICYRQQRQRWQKAGTQDQETKTGSAWRNLFKPHTPWHSELWRTENTSTQTAACQCVSADKIHRVPWFKVRWPTLTESTVNIKAFILGK